MHRLLLCIVALVLAACGDDLIRGATIEKKQRDDDAPALDKLAVKVNGAVVPMQQAFVKRRPPDAFQIYVTNRSGSCSELIDNVFDGSDREEIDVLVDVTPRLSPDGTKRQQLTNVYDGYPMKLAPGAKVSVRGNADPGTKVEIAIDVGATGDGDMKQLEVHGTLTAEGCGERDLSRTSGIPKAAHPSTATITVAGQKLPIRSAVIHGEAASPVFGAPKIRDLVLSTGPKDCGLWSHVTPAIDLQRVGGSWRLSGSWLANEVSSTVLPDPKTKLLAAKLGATGSGADGATVTLDLSGTGTIEEYAVAIEGTIEAIDCGTKK